ncbi:MAG: HAD family phosphatase [Cyclobacteriaceae bacterium]
MDSASFAVIFDMDGVIVDSNPAHKIALQAFCKQHGHELSEQQLREKIYGRTNRDWLTNLFGQLPDEQLRAFAEEKEALYRKIYAATIAPVAGLLNFLDMLAAHSVKRAIATSAPRANVDFTLAGTGTALYFETILDDTFVSRGKPDPEIYLKTVAALQMDARLCIVVEDSLSGIQAAQGAGCRVIGITTTHTAAELAHCDFVVEDFNGLTMKQLRQISGLEG